MLQRILATSRRGFTFIEVLIVLSIVGLLAGLLLPALEAARESARRAQCQGNLRQIGMAIQGYVTDFGCFVPGAVGYKTKRDLQPGDNSYPSNLCRLLRHLDHRPLYDAVNFDLGDLPDTFLRSRIWLEREYGNAVNLTVRETNISLFLCPSDSNPLPFGNSYRANTGLGAWRKTMVEYPDSGNGLFPEADIVTPSRVPDGLSQTAAFSERVMGSGGKSADPTRDAFGLPLPVRTADDLLLGCRIAARPGNDVFTKTGHSWYWAGRERVLYNHAQPPNGPIPDCLIGTATTAPGMATARSEHVGGVNVLMGDGACRFVSESIAQVVWRALGTRNGREVVE